MTRKRRGFDTPSKGLPFRHWGDGGDATLWGSDGFAALDRTIRRAATIIKSIGRQDSAAETATGSSESASEKNQILGDITSPFKYWLRQALDASRTLFQSD